MRRSLRVADLGDLLELPLLAVLATHRKNGSVLLSPVWHEWRLDGFDVVTGREDVKARHIRRDAGVSIVVCDHVPPYRGVELRCRAKLVTTGVPAAVRRIATRYLGEAAGAAWAERSTDDTLIRLEPGELRAWDFSDEYA